MSAAYCTGQTLRSRPPAYTFIVRTRSQTKEPYNELLNVAAYTFCLRKPSERGVTRSTYGTRVRVVRARSLMTIREGRAWQNDTTAGYPKEFRRIIWPLDRSRPVSWKHGSWITCRFLPAQLDRYSFCPGYTLSSTVHEAAGLLLNRFRAGSRTRACETLLVDRISVGCLREKGGWTTEQKVQESIRGARPRAKN